MNNKALTYSLLSHIRSKATLVDGPIDIFVPLIKRTLAKLNLDGIKSGKNISEIQTKAIELYSIDFPIPVLHKILTKISEEVNSEDNIVFIIYLDGSYAIKDFIFTEYEETINILKEETEQLEKLFKEFCEGCDGKDSSESIFQFIERSKLSLSKYLGNSMAIPDNDNGIVGQFITFFKNVPQIYEQIKRIYLGSVLSSFLEYKTDNIKVDLELLLDTNFIVALLDLNTPESTHTCNKIIEIANRQNFKLTVLKDTLNETEGLLRGKARYYDSSFLVKKVNPEDVYNACDRRNLNKADLERIADRLEKSLNSFGVTYIYDTTKYKNKAKHSKEFENLKKYRGSEFAALHDATAVYYVKEKRKKKIKDFEKVNCWFLNNTISRVRFSTDQSNNSNNGYQSESITADDLLNILWLSNPQINANVNFDELGDIGINSLLSLAVSEALPSSKIIQELEDNIKKYGGSDIDDTDILLISKRITNNELKDIKQLNRLAENNNKAFVDRLNEEAKIQLDNEKSRAKKFEEILSELKQKSNEFSEITDKIESKSKKRDDKIHSLETAKNELQDKLAEAEKTNRVLENNNRKKLRKKYISKKVRIWRILPVVSFLILCVLFWLLGYYIYSFNERDITKSLNQVCNFSNDPVLKIAGIVLAFLSSIIIGKLNYDRFLNTSQINSFKNNIEIPDELKSL